MSRYPYSQRYYSAPRQRAPRWPWVIVALMVVMLSGAGALLLAGDALSITGGLINRDRDTASTSSEQSLTIVRGETTEANAAIGQTAPEPEQPAANNPISVGGTTTEGSSNAELVADEDDANQSAAPTATAAAGDDESANAQESASTATAATPTPEGPSPVEVVEEWAALWSSGDYLGLYDLLAQESQATVSQEDFVSRYEAIAERAALTTVAVTITGGPNAESEVPVTVEFISDTVGDFSEDSTVPLIRDGADWKVQWSPGLIFKDLSTDGCLQSTSGRSERGMIRARDGEILAKDGLIAEIGIVPGDVTDEQRVLRELSRILSMPQAEIAAVYEDADPDWFIPIALVSEEEATRLLDPIGELEGVRVQTAPGRVYPHGSATAHITGYVSRVTAEDIDRDQTLAEGMWIGRAGLEAGADDILSGRPGTRLTAVECQTRAHRSLIAERPAQPGKDVILTIDLNLQLRVDRIMADVQGDEKGSAVVIDPQSGAILAMVSHPTYDPNGFVLGFSDREWRRITDEQEAPLLNRATQGSYPAGSIFKVITTAAAMENLGYTGSTTIDCPATFTLEGNTYADWVIEWGVPPQGTLTLHQALVQSCNTVFYQIGADLDRQDPMHLPNMARAFGLGAPTNIPYLPEISGVVPDPSWKLNVIGDGWSTGDAINLAIGQGYLLATPLQMANVYATIANGGTLLQPYIVDLVSDPRGGTEQIGERVELGTVPLSARQMSEMQAALHDQTSNAEERGSARVFGPTYPFAVAGKTGTAQNPSNRGEKPHSWFAAYGPYGDTPTIASAVLIETIGEGGQYAAPATKDIYDYYRQNGIATRPEDS